MPTPEQSEQFLETPEVAELVATHPEYDHDSRVQAFGPDEAPLVRGALTIADQLRHGHADPGDAFLQGLSYAEAVRKERLAREGFMRSMEQQTVLETNRPKMGRLRKILRATIFNLSDSSRGGGGDV